MVPRSRGDVEGAIVIAASFGYSVRRVWPAKGPPAGRSAPPHLHNKSLDSGTTLSQRLPLLVPHIEVRENVVNMSRSRRDEETAIRKVSPRGTEHVHRHAPVCSLISTKPRGCPKRRDAHLGRRHVILLKEPASHRVGPSTT